MSEPAEASSCCGGGKIRLGLLVMLFNKLLLVETVFAIVNVFIVDKIVPFNVIVAIGGFLALAFLLACFFSKKFLRMILGQVTVNVHLGGEAEQGEEVTEEVEQGERCVS